MKRVGLIVTVNEYEDDNIVDLRYALQDGSKVHGLLVHKAGFDEASIYFPNPANPDEILDKAENLVSGLQHGDLFFFYFAGHGKSDDGRQLLLFPKVRLNRLAHRQHTLEMSALRDCTAKEGVGRAFVIDACRSPMRRDRDATGQSFTGERGWRDVVASSARGSPIALMFSCAEGCQALESAAIGHGLFTFAFLEEVKAAVEAGAEIRLDDRFSIRLRERMTNVADAHELGREQRPWVQPGPGAEPPVLVPGRLREPVLPVPNSKESVSPPPSANAKVNPKKETVCINLPPKPSAQAKPEKENARINPPPMPTWAARFRVAAEQGDATAQAELGYFYGLGVAKDYGEAVRWYTKAAEQGNGEAQKGLGDCYYYGLGVAKDYGEAVRWYAKAAEQGLASAQCNLGICCEYGQGRKKDPVEAANWYRNAAEKGDAVARSRLIALLAPEQKSGGLALFFGILGLVCSASAFWSGGLYWLILDGFLNSVLVLMAYGAGIDQECASDRLLHRLGRTLGLVGLLVYAWRIWTVLL